MNEDRLLKNLITTQTILACACSGQVTCASVLLPELQNER